MNTLKRIKSAFFLKYFLFNVWIFICISHFSYSSDPNLDSLKLKWEGLKNPSNAIKNLFLETEKMPSDMKKASMNFLSELTDRYEELTDHQKLLLAREAVFTGKVLSKKHNPARFNVVHEKFKDQIEYVRNVQGFREGYGLFINTASKGKGGQRAFLINLRNGMILEVYCSSAWRGIGYNEDSDQTPLGFFRLSSTQFNYRENRTILGDIPDIFKKLKYQSWMGISKWLHRVSTKKEKAYINSNQFALKGQNYGDEEIPLTAVRDFYKGDTTQRFIDNSNSAIRHLYVHGTNRNDQLGHNLSGGCIRISNIFSYVLQNIYKDQKEIPVFIDYIKFREGADEIFHNIEDLMNDLESHETMEESYGAMAQTKFSRYNNIKEKVEDQIIDKIVHSFKNGAQNSIKIQMSSVLPLPESAMRDWLLFKDSVSKFATKKYWYNFDLDGHHRTSKNSVDPIVRQSVNSELAAKLIKHRLDFTKKYIEERVKTELEKFEIDYKEVKEKLIFEVKPVEFVGNYGNKADIGFDICDSRRAVLQNMEFLDSLAKVAPDLFIENEELGWINSYIDNPVQIFTRSVGGKTFEDIVTYNDALLAQAYIYAIGEIALKKHALYEGKILDIDDPEFYHLYKKDEIEYHNKLDYFGRKQLFKYTRGVDTKLNARALNGELKQNNQRILGIIKVSEEFFSRRKSESNILVIKHLLAEENPVLLSSW
ncbi:L,D-transpeptidase [Flexithrix dorotheae]|uniref:L,D-transpeptidase n=1 Tax=Flexithrix dorotheae TaxID=70993 RepID=UPI00036CC930|nr:L,D-transpeptidase [Flexithrix dorotheae]